MNTNIGSSSVRSALVKPERPLSMPTQSFQSRSSKSPRWRCHDLEIQCLEFSLSIFLESTCHFVFWESCSWIPNPHGSQKPLSFSELGEIFLCQFPAFKGICPSLSYTSSKTSLLSLDLQADINIDYMNMSQRFVEHTYQWSKYLTVWKLIGKQGISRGRRFQKKVGCENYASSHTGGGEWELVTHNICLSDLSSGSAPVIWKLEWEGTERGLV